MTHHKIAKVLYVSAVAMIMITGVFGLAYSNIFASRASAISTFIPYGASVISVAIPFIPNPGCPYYYLMENDAPTVQNPYPEFGLFFLPGSEGDTYDNQSIDIIGTMHIGGYSPVPELACGVTPTGGPIFPVSFDGLFFLDGGNSEPSF